MQTSKFDEREGGHYIFRRYIRKNGRRIYPTHGKAFRIWVKDEL